MAPLVLTLLGGAAFAQAVDVFFHTEAGCNTGAAVLGCTDLAKDTCCTFTNPEGELFNSVLYTGLPTNGDVNAMIFDGDNCTGDQWFPVGNLLPKAESYCVEAPYPAKGTSYAVYESGKREVGVYEVKRSEVADCVEKREADTLVLRDGTRFNISSLEKKDLRELVSDQ